MGSALVCFGVAGCMTDPQWQEIEDKVGQHIDLISKDIQWRTERLKEAQVVARAWNEGRKMAAPVIHGLADALRTAVADITKMATTALTELNTEVSGFKTDVEDVQAFTKEIKVARANVRGALGGGTNGGPPLDDQSPNSST